jgi:hypothetical protein
MSGDACVNCIVDQEPALGMPPSPCTRPPNLCWGCVARALDEVPTLSAEDETIIRSFEVGQLPNNFAYPL